MPKVDAGGPRQTATSAPTWAAPLQDTLAGDLSLWTTRILGQRLIGGTNRFIHLGEIYPANELRCCNIVTCDMNTTVTRSGLE